MKIEKDLQDAEAVTYPCSYLLSLCLIDFCFTYCLCKLVQEANFISGEGSL